MLVFCYSYLLTPKMNSNIFCILLLISAAWGVTLPLWQLSTITSQYYETESYRKMANPIKLLYDP